MTRPYSVGLLAALTTFACATPERVPLDAEAARHALMERATQEVSLEQSLAADLPGSLLVTPTPAACATPDQHGYWYLRAAAWSPEVRAQRRALGAAQMASKSAGAPGAIAVQVIDPDLQGDEGPPPSRASRRRKSRPPGLASRTPRGVHGSSQRELSWCGVPRLGDGSD